jgi:hypothetical protein
MKETEAARAVLIDVLNALGAKNSRTKKFSTKLHCTFKMGTAKRTKHAKEYLWRNARDFHIRYQVLFKRHYRKSLHSISAGDPVMSTMERVTLKARLMLRVRLMSPASRLEPEVLRQNGYFALVEARSVPAVLRPVLAHIQEKSDLDRSIPVKNSKGD